MIRPHGKRLIDRIISEEKAKSLKDQKNEFSLLPLSSEKYIELENLAIGTYSPLEGYNTEEEFESIIKTDRLVNGIAWTIPITYGVTEEMINQISKGDQIGFSYNDELVALMDIEDIYKPNKDEWIKSVFGTDDKSHPGATRIYNNSDHYLGGKIDLIKRPEVPFTDLHLTPKETRVLFKEKGWNTIVGFQTRNTPHLGHEYIQKTALTFVDGLFINPVIVEYDNPFVE